MEPSDNMTSVKWLDCIDSTNAELRRNIDSIDNLSVLATKEQTAGRGQGCHTWYASPGKNLTFSIMLKSEMGSVFAICASDALLLTCVASLSVRAYLADKGISARIKWPNDIWVEDKKICGMLIENRLDGSHIKESIIGIGLNINETHWPEELPNPISLSELSHESYNIEDELQIFLQVFVKHYLMLETTQGREYLLKEFNANVFKLGEERLSLLPDLQP